MQNLSDTRLDATIGGPGKLFVYDYSIISYQKKELDIEQLKSNLTPTIINNVKTNPDMEAFRVNKITVVYQYKDKSGVHLFEIKVTPSDYDD